MSKRDENRQLHICLFISALRRGGSERVLVNLAEYMHRQGVRVTMVNQYEGQDEYTLSEGIGRRYSEITGAEVSNNRVVNFIRRFKKLQNIWAEERPDVILSFIGKNNIMALLTARRLHIPVVVSVRGEPKEEYASRMMKEAAFRTFPGAATVVLQTKDAMKFFPESVQKKAVILKNPLNADFVRTPWQGERDHTIYAVGRVDANKNHEMLIRAFAAIAEEFPEEKLMICGQGELREQLIALTEELGLADRISLPGLQKDVAGRIEKGDAFVLCSDSEGMPNTLIEAMCLGLPSISTDCPCGGPGELIEDGTNGLLIPVHNQKALEEALRRLLRDPAAAAEMGRKAAKLIEEYAPEAVGASWLSCLESAAKQR